MVRVFRCHSFASQGVIPVSKEPLSICTDNDLVFVATRDCEIIIYQVTDTGLREIQRCPTISEVDAISYNNFKNYILTIELKKSWKRETKSVYVYLNWNRYNKESGKPRTKVSVAGRSHIQHASATSCSDIMEIIELPVDGNASCLAICKYTGNFAVACRSEIKLCSIVEKTVANSDKTYLDVEVFLELKWGFPIRSMSLCEEFLACCSRKEVHSIRIRFDEGRKAHTRPASKLLSSSSLSPEEEGPLPATFDKTDSAQFYLSDTFTFQDHLSERVTSLTFNADSEDSSVSATLPLSKDFSSVGMRPGARQSPKLVPRIPSESEIKVVDDVNFVEWNFQSYGATSAGAAACLPGLHSASTLSQCHHHKPSPPILTDFTGGKVKSSSRIQAETILHLSDSREKEDWISVTLVPTYGRGLPAPMQMSNLTTDRMKSSQTVHRTSMCCYVSGSRGGYLYNMYPSLTQVSSYKYTDEALQVGVSPSYLHVMTTTGIETYTSRWGIVSVEMSQQNEEEADTSCRQSYPSSNLDICLCGHEPFFNAVSLSIGRNFLALLSKVYDLSGKDESHWSIYVLHMHSLVDQYKEMIGFAEGIQKTGPASYIHLLQEAHLLLSTHPSALTEPGSNEVKHYLCEVNRLLADYYAQPGQEDWSLCCAYYKNCKATVHDIVMDAMERAVQNNQREFGKGLLEYLDSVLFSPDDYVSLAGKTSDAILQIYASSAPEKLSRVILLSNMKSFTTEKAYHFLKTWLSVKSSNSQTFSTIDKLAMAQLQLVLCDVESACSQLMSIHRPGLVDVCSSHLSLVCEDMTTFTPLAQLMRQHMANTLIEVLVEMLDKCVISLDSLLSLLNSQSDKSYNSHTREVLELILTDSKRIFLFEEAVHILCKIYVSLISEKIQPPSRQLSLSGQQKFSLPQGDGYFAPRFAWLDHLPPFYGPERISKPCVKLEIKQISGQSSRGSSIPLITKQANNQRCHCCSCNETLLKLQSLLCSPRLSTDLATFVLAKLEESRSCDLGSAAPDEAEYLESVSILCLTKLDLEKSTEQIIEKYPFVAGSFASCSFKGSLEKYQYMMAHMESVLKKFTVTRGSGSQEEMFVKAYKDLLTRLTETFSPSQFLELLPADGNIFFLLPFISASLKLEHVTKLKRKITDMGKSLLSQNS